MTDDAPVDHNPFTARLGRKKIGDTGRKAEKRLSKAVKGRLRPASGAFNGLKGDIVEDTFLVEVKSTENLSLGVKYDWLRKIAIEAQGAGKTPALSIIFTADSLGNHRPYGRWRLIPEGVFQRLKPSKD